LKRVGSLVQSLAADLDKSVADELKELNKTVAIIARKLNSQDFDFGYDEIQTSLHSLDSDSA
jgi:hypothetical protein